MDPEMMAAIQRMMQQQQGFSQQRPMQQGFTGGGEFGLPVQGNIDPGFNSQPGGYQNWPGMQGPPMQQQPGMSNIQQILQQARARRANWQSQQMPQMGQGQGGNQQMMDAMRRYNPAPVGMGTGAATQQRMGELGWTLRGGSYYPPGSSTQQPARPAPAPARPARRPGELDPVNGVPVGNKPKAASGGIPSSRPNYSGVPASRPNPNYPSGQTGGSPNGGIPSSRPNPNVR